MAAPASRPTSDLESLPPSPQSLPQPTLIPTNSPSRLSLPLPARLLFAVTASSALSFFLGASLGAHRAALIFRAENAHRQPHSVKGWYFYHKTKNYRTAWGGVRGGLKTAGRVGVWVGMYVVVEEAVDRVRGRVDAGGSVVAGLGVAGAVAAVHRLGVAGGARVARRGLMVGLGGGLVQDLVRWGRGQGGGVFEWVFGRRVVS
ncbi:hypothetical protein EDC01DRAFT_754421 [Geopyxis carbonaria]|nr:hypothetical protein EDC01DRAFT_754421 [Geopyxis carbonaria]